MERKGEVVHVLVHSPHGCDAATGPGTPPCLPQPWTALLPCQEHQQGVGWEVEQLRLKLASPVECWDCKDPLNSLHNACPSVYFFKTEKIGR